MIRHRREDEGFTAAFEAPGADIAEQNRPIDPIELAEDTNSEPVPTEADPADVIEQAESVALDDELRADSTSPLSWPKDSD